MTRRPSRSDPQVRYALREANLAFVKRGRRERASWADVLWCAVGVVTVLTYILRT